jgi:hypothetical protein
MTTRREFARSVRAAADRLEREAGARETVAAMDFTAELERMRSALFDAFAAELAGLRTEVAELRVEIARLKADRE